MIRLANSHPRVNILNPGPGVGGHCIAVDPWFLASSAPKQAEMISLARKINNKKCDWVINKVRTAIRKQKAHVIACLGLTYKADVADMRESPALKIVRALEKEIEVLRVDPFISNGYDMNCALDRAEIVVALVAHRPFKQIPRKALEGKVVLDFAGVFV